jgi:JAB1/Mov34/MPN/PAD-1 ubiquitin protease
MQDISCGSYQDGLEPTAACDLADETDKPQVIHARSGVPHEIMGLMQGKVVGTSLVIMDSFALPVQGTETRVNAASEANEYMVEYISKSEQVRRLCSIFRECLLTQG